jgi:predicted ATP-dependent serine protease
MSDPIRVVSDPFLPRRYVCSACGYVHMAWASRCSKCLSLDGIVASPVEALGPTPVPLAVVEKAPSPDPVASPPRLMIARDPTPEPVLDDPVTELADDDADAAIPLSEVAEATFVRDSTNLGPLDHVLGGGLVEASVVLLASPPGIGKSSLTLQMLNGLGHRCLYVSGEETREQIAATARRIGAASNKIYVLVERNLEKIFDKARKCRAQTIAIDSIQKMFCEDVGGRTGSTSQLKECTDRLVQFAKTSYAALWLIGHVTSDGDAAGPKTIEHDVDVLLTLEKGMRFDGNERILRCEAKNRFGATNVVGRFEMTPRGLVAVDPDGWDQEVL